MVVVALDASATVTVTAGEVLDVKVLSPEYTAVIALAATGSVVVAKVAAPPVSVPVPSKVVPLKNWTVPVGVPVVVGVTVAVKVTLWPATGAGGEEATTVVVVAVAATVTLIAGETIKEKLESPE